MNKPILSVTMSNYNYSEYIDQAIESVLNQTFKDFELIIVDNASNDNSVAIIKQYMKRDARIQLVEHKENQGAIASLVESCKLARGEYRLNLDADDWIANPQAFKLQIDVLESDPEINFVFSAADCWDDSNSHIITHPFSEDVVQSGENVIEVLLSLLIAHTGPMIRMSAYNACGGYDPTFTSVADLKLLYDLCMQGKVGYINQPLYVTRHHDLSKGKIDGSQKMTIALLHLTDIIFSGSLVEKMTDSNKIHKRLIRQLLTYDCIRQLFSGYIQLAWRTYWSSLLIRPYETLIQKQTIVMIVYTLLGAKGYNDLKQLIDTVKHQNPGRISETASIYKKSDNETFRHL